MKTCSKCQIPKDGKLFNKRSAASDGLSSWCKACYAEYDRARWAKGDKFRKRRNQERLMVRNKAFLWDLLCASSCLHCGETDPLVLEFDHRDPSEKSINVSEMIAYGLERIRVEIAKCDILCANCHRRRTIKQFGHWRGTMPPPSSVQQQQR